jgi:hypothetical protein
MEGSCEQGNDHSVTIKCWKNLEYELSRRAQLLEDSWLGSYLKSANV